MEIDLRIQAITALQQAWQTCHASARLYRALAEREPSAKQRMLLLQLAVNAERHADRRAHWLRRLGAPLPPNEDTICDHVWRWVLVRRGCVSAITHGERTVDRTLIRSAMLLAALSHTTQRRRQGGARP
jgi:hypothetical protein